MKKDIYRNIEELLEEESGGSYDDIIAMPHHQSPTRKHMSIHDRAAQFAPFAALTGYEEAIGEEGRITSEKREVTVEEQANIDKSLYELMELTENYNMEKRKMDCASTGIPRPVAEVEYFVDDRLKAGGSYVKKTFEIKMVDPVNRVIITKGDVNIRFEDLTRIKISKMTER